MSNARDSFGKVSFDRAANDAALCGALAALRERKYRPSVAVPPQKNTVTMPGKRPPLANACGLRRPIRQHQPSCLDLVLVHLHCQHAGACGPDGSARFAREEGASTDRGSCWPCSGTSAVAPGDVLETTHRFAMQLIMVASPSRSPFLPAGTPAPPPSSGA